MKRKLYLKDWGKISIFVLSLIAMIGITSSITKSFLTSIEGDNISYVLRDFINSDLPVAVEVDKKIIKPFDDDNIKILRDFYDINGKKEDQEKSLILYENTYMPNTGIMYGSDEPFDVLSIYEGKVKDVVEDEIFGFIVEVEYANNLICKYSSLASVEVDKGDNISIGEIIGRSGINKLISDKPNMLLFELIYDGVNVDPKLYYDKTLNEMR